MNYFNFLSSPTAQALGHAILYSLWQAFIIFICLRLVLKCMPHASSRFKHTISYIAHLGIGAWFLITLLQQLSVQQNNFNYPQIIQPAVMHPQVFDHSTSTIYNGLSFSFLNNYLAWIVAVYFAGIVWFTVRLTFSYFQTIRLRQKGLIDFDSVWQHHIQNLSHSVGIRKTVHTYISRYIETPVMIGFFKPVILLPLAVINKLSPQQIEAILLHELAHIRRNDYLLNIIQSVIDTLLFFNPFSRWISKNIRYEREKSCDEMVLQSSEPHLYARALLALGEVGQNNRLALAAISKHRQLLHRIKNIMEMKNKHTHLRHKLAALAIVIAATISVAWFSPKENKNTDSEKAIAPSKTVTSIIAYSANRNGIINATDTSAPGVIPPLPPVPPIPPTMLTAMEAPTPPVPVLPLMIPVPPMPPVAPLQPIPPALASDTLPLMDSASVFHFKQFDSGYFRKFTEYFNSNEWKKQMQDIQKSTAGIQQYLQSKEWKQQLEMIQKNNEKFQKNLLNNEAWKKQMEDIKKNAINLQKEYFNSPEWNKQMEEIKKNTQSLKHYFNSDEWKKQQEQMKHVADSLKTYFNSSEWKEQQKNLQEVMAQTKKYFESDEWKAQQQELRKIMEESKEMNGKVKSHE